MKRFAIPFLPADWVANRCALLTVLTATAWLAQACSSANTNADNISPCGDSVSIAACYYNLGAANELKRDYDHAIEEFTRAIRTDPNYVKAIFQRGLVYQLKGDPDRSIQDFDEAIRLDPKNPIAFYNRGIAYQDKDEDDRAIADYDEAIRLNPNYANALNNRSNAYFENGDFDRALDDANELLKVDPKHANAHVNLGKVYRVKGEYDRAISESDRAIGLNPNLEGAFLVRAAAYAAKGDFEHADADYAEALRVNPKSATPLVSRAQLRFNQGRFDLAATDLAAVVAVYPAYAYGILRLHIARGRGAISDLNEFSRNAAKVDLAKWPGPVIGLYLDKQTAAQTLAAAAQGNTKTRTRQSCQAAFFIANMNSCDKTWMLRSHCCRRPQGRAVVTTMSMAMLSRS